MDEIKYLNKNINIVIDHPIGSNGKNFIYPVNCGYLLDNGKRIDVYVLGVYVPLQNFVGECTVIIKEIDDYKLIVAGGNQNYTDEQIEAFIEFQEKDNDHLLIRKSDFVTDEMMRLARGLMYNYQIQIESIKRKIIYILTNNISDVYVIESILDSLLGIPTVEGEKLCNFLCNYLEKINNESAKFYRLEYKNIWK